MGLVALDSSDYCAKEDLPSKFLNSPPVLRFFGIILGNRHPFFSRTTPISVLRNDSYLGDDCMNQRSRDDHNQPYLEGVINFRIR